MTIVRDPWAVAWVNAFHRSPPHHRRSERGGRASSACRWTKRSSDGSVTRRSGRVCAPADLRPRAESQDAGRQSSLIALACLACPLSQALRLAHRADSSRATCTVENEPTAIADPGLTDAMTTDRYSGHCEATASRRSRHSRAQRRRVSSRSACRACFDQTYSNWVYTVLDNASTDNTPDVVTEIAKRDSRIHYRRFDELVDGNESHNRAFRSIPVESEFAKVVQADDWLYPECLERMVEVAEAWTPNRHRRRLPPARDHGRPGRSSIPRNRRERKADSRSVSAGRSYVTGSPTALLFRSRFVRERDPFYLDAFEHADTEAVYSLLSHTTSAMSNRCSRSREGKQGPGLNGPADEHLSPENIRFLIRFGPPIARRGRYRRAVETRAPQIDLVSHQAVPEALAARPRLHRRSSNRGGSHPRGGRRRSRGSRRDARRPDPAGERRSSTPGRRGRDSLS